MLVISETGEKLGVLNKDVALKEAEDRGLDLVLVSPDSNPPVAKIMDYPKYRFEQQKRLKEMKKNQKIVEIQEIRLSPTIEKHDIETKLRNAKSILEKGNKVKITIKFKGRMIVHQELGREVINNFIESLGENIIVDSNIKLDGKVMQATIAPKIEKKKE